MELEEKIRDLEERVLDAEVTRREQTKVYLPMFTQAMQDIGALKSQLQSVQDQVSNHLPTQITEMRDRVKGVEIKLSWLMVLLITTLLAALTNLASRLGVM